MFLDLDEDVILALKRRAARNGRSAEAEHPAILGEALAEERVRPSFKASLDHRLPGSRGLNPHPAPYSTYPSSLSASSSAAFSIFSAGAAVCAASQASLATRSSSTQAPPWIGFSSPGSTARS